MVGARGDRCDAVALAGSLGWFWRIRGQVAEGRPWFDLVLADLPAPESHAEAADRCWTLTNAGLLRQFQFDLPGAEEQLHQAARIAEEHDDDAAAGWAWHGLGRGANDNRDLDRARRCFERSIGHFRRAGDERGGAYSTYFLGFVLVREGDLDQAEALFAQAAEPLEAIGDLWGLATLYLLWSNPPTQRGEFAVAARRQALGLDCAASLGSPVIVGRAMLNLAATAHGAGHHQWSVRLHGAAQQLAALHGTPVARTDKLAQRHLAAARAHLGDASCEDAWRSCSIGTLADAVEVGRRAAAAIDAPPSPEAWRQELSAREFEVLETLTTGASNKEMAEQLGISVRTVEAHLGHVYAKLGVAGRVEATLRYLRYRR